LVLKLWGTMNNNSEALRKALSSLPLPLIAVLTMRSALRYLPAFLASQDTPRGRPSWEVQVEAQRAKFSTPFTRFLEWLDKGSRERDAADEKRLADRTVAFRGFYACHTALFATSFAIVCSDKQSIVDCGRHHAAATTHEGVRLGFSDAVNWNATARAAVMAASSATTAALVRAGAPTPGSPEEQGANAVLATLGVADLDTLADELAAEITAVQGTYAQFSTASDSAASFAEASKMLSLPLWAREMPAEFERTWSGVRQKLLDLDAGFDVWVAWYEKRLAGEPLDMVAEERWTRLSEAWFDIDPVHANVYLRCRADGGAAREPAPALLVAASKDKDAREERKRRRTKVRRTGGGSLLARLLWKSDNWRHAIRTALSWGNLLALPFATYAVVSFLIRHLGIMLHVPILVFGLDVYVQLREWLFSFTTLPSSYAGLSVPGWLKDLSFLYFYLGGATYWVLSTYYAARGRAKQSFDFVRGGRRFFALLWARLAWPWHFLGFYMGWVDPLRVYSNIDPEIYHLLRVSRDGDGSRPVSVKVTRMLDDNAKTIMFARFIPFFVVYVFLVAVAVSLILFCNALIGG
jgi:hypothetical protein